MTHASGRHFLQIPGPTNVPDRVLRAIEAIVAAERLRRDRRPGLPWRALHLPAAHRRVPWLHHRRDRDGPNCCGDRQCCPPGTWYSCAAASDNERCDPGGNVMRGNRRLVG